MSTPSIAAELAERLGAGTARGRLYRTLLAALAEGRPVPPARLAAELHSSLDEVQAQLKQLPNVEWSAEREVLGAALTLSPTSHVLTMGGQRLYTWCALDLLLFPPMLGQLARATSRCALTGRLIHLTVTPTGITDAEPPEAVVSLVRPGGGTALRRSFCAQVHLFSSRAAAETWLAQHPGGEVIRLSEAFLLAQEFGRAFSDSGTDCW